MAVANHSLRSVGWTVAEEPLGALVPLAHELPRALRCAAGLDRIAQGAGVRRDLSPRWTAEQLAHRGIEEAPLEVPQRAVDGADRHHGDALAAVDRGAIEDVPDHLVRQRVGAHEMAAQLHVDHKGLFKRDRAADANDAVVRLDFDEVRLDAVRAVAGLAQDIRALGPIGRIEVDRSN